MSSTDSVLPKRPDSQLNQRSELGSQGRKLLVALPFGVRLDVPHGARVTAQLLLRLAERHRIAVIYLHREGSAPIDPRLVEVCEHIERFELGNDDSRAFRFKSRLGVVTAPFTGIPSTVSAVHSRRFLQRCSRLAQAWKPDVIQVEHDDLAYLGPGLRSSGPRAGLILTCHEPGATAARDLVRTHRGRQRIAHRIDARSWKRYLAGNLQAFDAVVALTDEDRRELERYAPAASISRIGLGIDIPEIPDLDRGTGEPRVVYIGAYRHPPNVIAALRLLSSIMPVARRQIPGLRLSIVGAKPSAEIYGAATADDEVTGTVPSTEPYLSSATVVALPISTGGGMRVKLLEALAAGKAVVASPVAAAGLRVTNGEELVLAETDEQFAAVIVRLIEDPAYRMKLERESRRWAIANLSWSARVHDYERLYDQVLTAGRA